MGVWAGALARWAMTTARDQTTARRMPPCCALDRKATTNWQREWQRRVVAGKRALKITWQQQRQQRECAVDERAGGLTVTATRMAVATTTTMEMVMVVTTTNTAVVATGTASGTDNNQLTAARETVMATVGIGGNTTTAAAERSHAKLPGGGAPLSLWRWLHDDSDSGCWGLYAGHDY
jgi:hypothetical protein